MPSDKPVSKASEHRRSNKPIMEKKRRARINNCLNELKNLLLEAMRKDPARHSKLEKADILEMTVKHLQHLQHQQMALAVAADPGVVTKYRAGFNECAEQVSRYVGTLDGIDSPVKQRLLNHLANCINGLHGVMAATTANRNVGVDTRACGPNSAVVPRFKLVPGRLPNGEIALLLPNRAVANWQFTNQHLMSVYNNNAPVPSQLETTNAFPAKCTRVVQRQELPRRNPPETTTLLTVNVDYGHSGSSRSSPSVYDDAFSLSPGHSPDSCRSSSLSPSTSDCSEHFGHQNPDLANPLNATAQLPPTGLLNAKFQHQNAGLRWNCCDNGATRIAEPRTVSSKNVLEKRPHGSIRQNVEQEVLMPVDLSKDADKMWRPW